MVAVISTRSTIDEVPAGEYVPTADQRIVMYGVSWDAFESFLSLRGETRPLVTYLDGTLEIMSPSANHEMLKKSLAAIVEAYLLSLGLTFRGVGSWLIKHAPNEAGLEPDECYVIGDLNKERPDLAIEVVWTSGGIDKLEVYRRIGVPEVWFWRDQALSFHVLENGGYEERASSACIPGIDRALVSDVMALDSLSAVLRTLRDRLPLAR